MVLAALLVCAPQAAAQDAPPAETTRDERVRELSGRTWDVHATRVRGTFTFDGHVNDEVWQRAAVIADFYQNERNEGLPGTERTEVRVAYDDERLYIGWICFDSEPEKVRANAIFRDESGGSDDIVSVMLDAYHGHRTAIQFVSNANGLMQDLLQSGENERTRNQDFNAVWEAKGQFTERGYEVEMAIPFRSLRFDPPHEGEEAVFGIGFKRNIPRKNEDVMWPFVPNDSSWYRPAELGHVRGMTDIRPGRNVQLRPYLLGGGLRDFKGGGDGPDWKRDAGLDAKWGVTTGLTADLTINTDFAQEEADVQQINLTRFSLSFPEKRQFFLEGQQAFQFGNRGEADLVFTRRIGLTGGGEVVPILAGARLSGRQGRTTIGAMNIQTGDHDAAQPGQNFSVLRLSRDLGGRSSVGALFTNVQGDGTFNRVAGVDGSFYFKNVWFIDGWFAAMNASAADAGGHAGYGRVAYDADRLGASYAVLDVGDAFRPGVGFIRRRDVRSHRSNVRWSPRPDSRFVRQYHFTGGFSYTTDQRSVLESRDRNVNARAEFESGDSVSVKVGQSYEFISSSFPIQGRTVPAGVYRATGWDVDFNSFRRRPYSLMLSVSSSDFWTGDRQTLTTRVSHRFNSHVGVSGSYDVNWIDLAGDAFTTHLASARLQLAFRNDLALFSLLQWNTSSRQLAANVRLHWIPRLGSDVFLVYSETDDRPQSRFLPRNRSLVAKINYLFQL